VLYSSPPTNFTAACTPSPLPGVAQTVVQPGDTVPSGATPPGQARAPSISPSSPRTLLRLPVSNCCGSSCDPPPACGLDLLRARARRSARHTGSGGAGRPALRGRGPERPVARPACFAPERQTTACCPASGPSRCVAIACRHGAAQAVTSNGAANGTCNAALPNDTIYKRFLYVVSALANNGFYVIVDNHLSYDSTYQNQGQWTALWAQARAAPPSHASSPPAWPAGRAPDRHGVDLATVSVGQSAMLCRGDEGRHAEAMCAEEPHSCAGQHASACLVVVLA